MFRYSFLWKGNYFSRILWRFSKIIETLVKNVMKTADVSKLFMAIFQRSYYDISIQFCTPHLKKSPKKPNQNWVKCFMKTPIRQILLQTSLFIVQFSTRCLKTRSWTFFYKKSTPNTMHLRLLWNLFQWFHQLALWAQRLDKDHCSKTCDQLCFCALENIWIEISNDFLLYRVVIRETLWIWPNAPFF